MCKELGIMKGIFEVKFEVSYGEVLEEVVVVVVEMGKSCERYFLRMDGERGFWFLILDVCS